MAEVASGPDTERTADRDELTDVVGGVIGGEQNGTQIGLVVLAGRHLRRQIVDLAGQPLQFFARSRVRRDASAQALSFGGVGSFGQ